MSADFDALSREIAATSDAVRLAIAAVKANPRHELYPLPWGRRGIALVSGDGYIVGGDLLHIAAAVNAAPVLIAEVERLSATLAELQARFDELHSAAREVAEVARLRDEFNPPDDGRLWVSRWQNAISDLTQEVKNG